MIYQGSLSAYIKRRTLAEPGAVLLWAMLFVAALAIVPPVLFLLKESFIVQRFGSPPRLALENFVRVLRLSGWSLWRVTLVYAAGSSSIAIFLGVSSAWLIVRTNACFRQITIASAYLSLAVPVIIKGVGWILLLGPNTGVVNVWLRNLFALHGSPIALFSLAGMTALEGVFWMPAVLLLSIPIFSAADPALEEAALMCGASLPQSLRRVALPLARPGVLAILFLTFMRSLDSFETPLLIGIPGNLKTFTTTIYETIYRGFLPQYGEASAYAVVLMLLMTAPLAAYYRVVRESKKYATITGRGYRSSRFDLGAWRFAGGLYLLTIPATLLAPLAVLSWASFLPTYRSPPRWSDVFDMSLDNYRYVLTRPLTADGLWNGLVVAALSATAVAAFAFVAAWLVVRRKERVRWLLDALGSLPLVFPGVVLATALMIEFLSVRFIPIYETVWALVLAFAIQFAPYGLRFCHSGILAIDPHLEESACACGANLRVLFRRIVLPLALPSVAAVWIYVFLHSIRDLSIPVMLSGPESQMVSGVILDLWNDGKIPQVGAMSIILAVTVALFGWAFMRVSKRYGAQAL
jgi:iron(III) transport system permease protein